MPFLEEITLTQEIECVSGACRRSSNFSSGGLLLSVCSMPTSNQSSAAEENTLNAAVDALYNSGAAVALALADKVVEAKDTASGSTEATVYGEVMTTSGASMDPWD